jgi:hypothetical protein
MRFAAKVSTLLIAFAAITTAQTAYAGLLLEPYAGYAMGSSETKLGASGGGGTYQYDNSGVGLGARIGYTMPLLWLALDYSMANGVKSKAKTTGATDADIDSTTLAAVIGVKVPLIRAWVGYSPMNKATAKGNNIETKLEGSQLKVGAGFTGLPFVSINVEYRMTEFKKYEQGGVSADMSSSAVYESSKGNDLFVSVSVPFDL